MKKMGFVKSEKENERRIALLPDDMDDLKDFADYLVFETGYGKEFGIDDKEYQANGAHTAAREEILRTCDIVCDRSESGRRRISRRTERGAHSFRMGASTCM